MPEAFPTCIARGVSPAAAPKGQRRRRRPQGHRSRAAQPSRLPAPASPWPPAVADRSRLSPARGAPAASRQEPLPSSAISALPRLPLRRRSRSPGTGKRRERLARRDDVRGRGRASSPPRAPL